MLQIRKKISHRFFLAIMLVVVIPIGVMGYQSYLLVKKMLTTFAFLHMATIAESRANHLDTWLGERLDDIGVLSRLPAIRDACRKYCESNGGSSSMPGDLLKSTLDIIEGTSPSYENIYIMLQDGRIVASTHPELSTAQGFHEQEVIERLQASDDPVIGPAFQHEDREGWYVHLTAKIRDDNGKTLAFIMAVLDLSETIDPIMVERIGLGETGEAYLVNEDRRIISESRFLDWPEMLDQSFDTHAIRSVLEKKKGTAVYESYMGREVLGSYVWLPRYQWGIVAEMETDEVMWPLKWIRIIGVLTTMMVGGVCLLMAYVVSRRVSMPIAQVADAAERMAAGELKQRIPFSSKDEVGRLARSFNVMAQQLSQSVTSLRQKEESLQKAYNELIAAQEQLLHSEKMAAIGELVTSVAHEMRSPLSSIKLNLQIIGRSLGRETALFEHYLIAIDQVEQMERMFSDLLNYSKPLDIRRKEISVEDLVDKCVQELAGEIAARSVAIERAIPEELPPIIGDPDKIEQVLVNVLKNALDASERNGKIDVSASTEESESGSMVIITVEDHGSGISQRNLKSIFQPFFTTKKRGTGLGLAIVKKIMDAHRGDIAVSSEQGRGTTVQLAFQGFRGVI